MPAAEPAALRILRAAVARGSWERPWLLVGRGALRDRAAREAARAVLCDGRREGSADACGACGPCGRFARGLHPDFHELQPEKNRVSIGIEAVEAARERLGLRPLEGRASVLLVPGAEALTDAAQNALLKTLEEPPPRTAILLTAAAPRALLATLRSRCVCLRLPPSPEAGEGEDLAEAGPLLARAFAPGPGADPLGALGPAAAWVRGKGGTLEDQRARLRAGWRLLLRLHLRGEAPYNGVPPRARRARLEALGEARERIERNVDPVGVMEALAVALAAADKDRQGS